MSLLFRFPFRWGAPQPVIPEPVPEPPFWTRVTVGSQQWLAIRAELLPRFEHIYPEADTGPGWTKITDVEGD